MLRFPPQASRQLQATVRIQEMQKVSENITIFEEVPQVVLFALSLSLSLFLSLFLAA